MSALPPLIINTHAVRPTTFPFISPAERVLAANHAMLQTVGFLFIFVRALRNDSLPATLCAALALAGAEKQPVAKLWGHAVQELPQRFVAALLAAEFPLVGVLLAAGGDVGGALPLAAVVQVARFGRVQTGVAVFLGVDTLETFWGHCEHA